MSPPAQNERPAARSTTARASSSAAACAMARARPRRTDQSTAFSTSGRLSVIQAKPSSGS